MRHTNFWNMSILTLLKMLGWRQTTELGMNSLDTAWVGQGINTKNFPWVLRYSIPEFPTISYSPRSAGLSPVANILDYFMNLIYEFVIFVSGVAREILIQ